MNLLLTAALLVLGASSARAQELAVDPADGPIRDYDDAAENYSEFWERALSPAAGTYEDLVAQAVTLIGTDKRAGDARTLLSDAIASRPDAPVAYFWLGHLELELENFAACASALEAARTLAPGFRAPPNAARLPSGWQLEYELGVCLARSDRLREAAERFASIMTAYPSCTANRTATDCYYWQVPFRLGETLMALGRLEEAIAVLREGDTGAIDMRYALAIALERDEQLAEAKEILTQSISTDSGLRSLSSATRLYIPATDELYYRGLAHASRGELAHARLFFGSYLAEAADSPWSARAAVHLALANKGGAETALLEVKGIDMASAGKALVSSYQSFEKCTAGVPDQLFEAVVTQELIAGERGPTESRVVTISHYDPLGKKRESTEIIAITSCLRAAGQAMSLPPLATKGDLGARAQLRFYVGGK